MNYYQTLNRVYREIEFKIREMADSGVQEKLFVYYLTKQHPVSETAIKKRIKDMIELGIIKREADHLVWVKRK